MAAPTAIFPPVIDQRLGANRPEGVFTAKEDPTKLLVGVQRFLRPSLSIPKSNVKFEWPLGLEGISVRGASGLSEHRYLGDNALVVQIVHRDARRLELTGEFGGKTGSDNMRELLAVITAQVPLGYWILKLPYDTVAKEYYVVVENYDFTHRAEDRNDSWEYSVNFIFTGVGAKLKVPKKTAPPNNPISSKKPKGKSNRVFTTKSGANTLRAIAKLVYGNANRWKEIYVKNQLKLSTLNVPLVQMQYKRLPYGWKLNY